MSRRTRSVGGMALIAVLWIVAALSVLVIGMTKTVRQQIRVASTLQEEVSGQAIGEAAIVLALQAMQTRTEPMRASTRAPVAFGGIEVEVEAMPLDGLISLNGASVPLLATLLQNAGGLDAGRAQALAQVMVEWRDQRPAVDPTAPGGANVSARRFEAVEDLLLVPGVDYPLYARLRNLVTADMTGGERVNPMAAPADVLGVLAGGNAAGIGGLGGAIADAGFNESMHSIKGRGHIGPLGHTLAAVGKQNFGVFKVQLILGSAGECGMAGNRPHGIAAIRICTDRGVDSGRNQVCVTGQ